MKKITRIGVFFIVLGVSIFSGMYIKDSRTINVTHIFDIYPLSQEILYGHLSPRDIEIRLRVSSPENASVDIYFMHEESFNLWNGEKPVETLFSDENISFTSTVVHIPRRATYFIIVCNQAEEAVSADLNYLIYGLEQDLLLSSAILVTAGLLISISTLIVTRLKIL